MTMEPDADVTETAKGRSGGVQSIERAFAILEALAANGGVMGLSALAAEANLPLPTIHRLSRTLVDLGYLRQEPSRQYALGPRILLLAESSSTMLSVIARPHLARLVDELGETANLASLDGDQIVYIVAGAVPAFACGCSPRSADGCCRTARPSARRSWRTARRPRSASCCNEPECPGTPNTPSPIPTNSSRQLAWSAEHGYAIDDGEQELGVRCVAVAVPPVQVARPGEPGRVGVRAGRPDDAGDRRARGAAADRRRRRAGRRPELTPTAARRIAAIRTRRIRCSGRPRPIVDQSGRRYCAQSAL